MLRTQPFIPSPPTRLGDHDSRYDRAATLERGTLETQHLTSKEFARLMARLELGYQLSDATTMPSAPQETPELPSSVGGKDGVEDYIVPVKVSHNRYKVTMDLRRQGLDEHDANFYVEALALPKGDCVPMMGFEYEDPNFRRMLMNFKGKNVNYEHFGPAIGQIIGVKFLNDGMHLRMCCEAPNTSNNRELVAHVRSGVKHAMLAEVSLGYYNYMREEVKDAGFKIFYMQADHVAICMKGRLKTAITSVQLSESIDRWYEQMSEVAQNTQQQQQQQQQLLQPNPAEKVNLSEKAAPNNTNGQQQQQTAQGGAAEAPKDGTKEAIQLSQEAVEAAKKAFATSASANGNNGTAAPSGVIFHKLTKKPITTKEEQKNTEWLAGFLEMAPELLSQHVETVEGRVFLSDFITSKVIPLSNYASDLKNEKESLEAANTKAKQELSSFQQHNEALLQEGKNFLAKEMKLDTGKVTNLVELMQAMSNHMVLSAGAIENLKETLAEHKQVQNWKAGTGDMASRQQQNLSQHQYQQQQQQQQQQQPPSSSGANNGNGVRVESMNLSSGYFGGNGGASTGGGGQKRGRDEPMPQYNNQQQQMSDAGSAGKQAADMMSRIMKGVVLSQGEKEIVQVVGQNKVDAVKVFMQHARGHRNLGTSVFGYDAPTEATRLPESQILRNVGNAVDLQGHFVDASTAPPQSLGIQNFQGMPSGLLQHQQQYQQQQSMPQGYGGGGRGDMMSFGGGI